MYFLGVDLGTSSIKAGVFSDAGAEVAIVDRECLTIPEGTDPVEFDAGEYWQATAAVIREAIRRAGLPASQIAALSVSSHGETLFPVDESGHPVAPAILTLDTRAVEEAEALAR